VLRGGRNHGFAISAASLRHSSLSCSSFESSTTGTGPAHADKRYKNREIQNFLDIFNILHENVRCSYSSPNCNRMVRRAAQVAQAREADQGLQLPWENLKEMVSINLNLFEYYIF